MAGSSQFFDGLSSGLARGLGSLAQARRAYQVGSDDGEQAQAKIAQALASIRASDASAGLHQQQASDLAAAAGRAAQRPGLVDAALAASAGVDVPTLNAWRQKHTTGQAPQVPMGPPAEDGGMGLGSMQIQPAAASRLGQALARFLPASTAEKDINPEQWAKASGLYQDQDQEAAAARGDMSPMALSVLRYAAKGGAPYHFDSTGFVGNQLTGALDTSNPGAQSTLAVRKEDAGAKRANAAQSYAAAGASNAHAGLFNVQAGEIASGRGGKGGSYGKAPTGYRWAADGQTLEAIPGGPAIKDKDLNEGQSNALTFASRMQAAHDTLDALSARGVNQPSLIKRGVDAVPFIGPALGMAANAVASEDQQQVEQAQRDFINAVLRRESGAAISEGEFANAAQQYFPQPNDKPKAIEQKRLARRRVIDGMLQAVPTARRPGAAVKAPAGGGGGSWDDAAAATGAWKIERVN